MSHVALRAKPAGLGAGPSGGRRGRGWWEGELGSSPSPTWPSWTVDAGREEACVYATDLLPVVSTPLKCWRPQACTPGSCGPERRYNESIKNCIFWKNL